MRKILILGTAIFLVAAGCNIGKQGVNQQLSQQTKTFSTTIRTGFEGYFTDTTISMDYDPARFAVALDTNRGNQVLITDLETNATAGVRIINNDGPGFSNSADAWNNLVLCAGCKATSDQIGLSGHADVKSYESATQYWQVFSMDPGFVIIYADKPLAPFLPVIKSLKFSNSKITPA
ncbi:hypothetical protein KGQ24_03420 [Patescibacteria group bacterium]|nr:hypothetical protein [Patescibacteria group bacterium]